LAEGVYFSVDGGVTPPLQGHRAEVSRTGNQQTFCGERAMRKSIIILAAASIFTVASAAIATAQVKGIRHSDGSWTFVDANGRDIHTGRVGYGSGGTQHDRASARSEPSRHDRESHKGGYLPWLSR